METRANLDVLTPSQTQTDIRFVRTLREDASPRFRKTRPTQNASFVPALFLGAIWLVVDLLCIAPAQALMPWTCGHGDGPGKKLKTTCKDTSGKVLNVYCIDGIFAKGELVCGAKTVCLATCVFDLGQNITIFEKDAQGAWTKIIWYNWDPKKCGIFFRDLPARKAGESKTDYADRIRRFLEGKNCDYNCYTWTKPKPGGQQQSLGIRPASLGEDRIDLTLEAVREGRQETYFIPEEEIEQAFGGGIEVLRQEPAMFEPGAGGQAGDGRDRFVDDYEDGDIGASYSALPGTEPPYIENGDLKFYIAAEGEGIEIDVSDFQPDCVSFQDLNISPMAFGDGIEFLTLFESNNSIGLQIFQDDSVVIKVEENKGGARRFVRRRVDGINVDDITHVQIDWVSDPGRIDRIEIEIRTKDGKRINKRVRSGLTHDGNNTVKAYRLRGIKIERDPQICIGSIEFAQGHSDVVDGVTFPLTVQQVSLLPIHSKPIAVGEIGSLTALAQGVFDLGIPDREFVFTVVPEISSGWLVFSDAFALRSEEGTEVTLQTDRDGFAQAWFTPIYPGSVFIEVFNDQSALCKTAVIEIIRDPNDAYHR